MLLRKIVLHNIRSYADLSLDFPEGITLLSGDIGSGKSTILLAIEFALFGIQRGEMLGAGLLRHGEKTGWVGLTFELNNRNYEIMRTLRRASNSVAQDEGYIMIDGVREDATGTELKARVLDLLGYPSDLLTKGKSVLYRYTVYTPQEEMKRIIEAPEQERMATLRRLFGIDNYERIQQNAKPVVSTLREKERELDGMLAALPAQQQALAQLRIRLAEIDKRLTMLAPQLDQARIDVDAAKRAMAQHETVLRESARLKQELSGLEAQQRMEAQGIARTEQEMRVLEQQIAAAAAMPKPVSDATMAAKGKGAAETALRQAEIELQKAQAGLVEAQTRLRISEQMEESITRLDTCPTCKQPVTAMHRNKIHADEQGKRAMLVQEKQGHEAAIASHQALILKHKAALEAAREQEQRVQVALFERRLAEERRSRLADLRTQGTLQQTQTEQTRQRFDETRKQLKALGDIEALSTTLRQSLERCQDVERKLSIEHAQSTRERDTLGSRQQELNDAIMQLEQRRLVRERIAAVRDWLQNQFVPLVGTIETHVLAAVHLQFNALFREWFALMVDDDELQASIGGDFGIALLQNGHDQVYEHLSGGERSAIALAYRLALNRVVNELVTTIATRNLLILDEPTDGFSAEQLEKVRDVLRQMECKQLLLVSHEQELEGFADTVIRIAKRNGASAVV
jgi:exonuclease SbcC